MKRLYISGPMTGLPGENKEAFSDCQAYYESLSWEVVNPHMLSARLLAINPKADYTDFLVMDIEALNTCAVMVLLPGYKKSFGCQFEIAFATKKGIPIFHAYTDKRADLQVNIAVITAYDKISNVSRIPDAIQNSI